MYSDLASKESIPHVKKMSRSYATTCNFAEGSFKKQHPRLSCLNRNLEAFSTMDSSAQSKSMIFCLNEILIENYFDFESTYANLKIIKFDEAPNYFDESLYFSAQNNGSEAQIDSDREEDRCMTNNENYYIQANNNKLKDIIEVPEESLYDRSPSINSQVFKRITSNEDLKCLYDPAIQSKDDSISNNLEKYSKIIKTGNIFKKGILFFNERVLTLIAIPKLYYISNGVEKIIDLNPTTTVKRINAKSFEIINYYPDIKFKFRTRKESECEEWVSILQNTVLTLE